MNVELYLLQTGICDNTRQKKDNGHVAILSERDVWTIKKDVLCESLKSYMEPDNIGGPDDSGKYCFATESNVKTIFGNTGSIILTSFFFEYDMF